MNNEDEGPSETAKTSEKDPKEDNLKHSHKEWSSETLTQECHYVR
jgi:hypothetical protein